MDATKVQRANETYMADQLDQIELEERGEPAKQLIFFY